jgi:ABC-type transporter Mla MlaB component
VNGLPIALSGPEEIRGTAMLRITMIEGSRSAVTLRVEGRITGCWVEELRRVCDAHTLPDEVQLSLELADVSFADAAGIVLLKELRSRGVGLVSTNSVYGRTAQGWRIDRLTKSMVIKERMPKPERALPF